MKTLSQFITDLQALAAEHGGDALVVDYSLPGLGKPVSKVYIGQAVSFGTKQDPRFRPVGSRDLERELVKVLSFSA